jgi:flavorubredoxin
MNAIQLKDSIYWVGAIDWDLRNFHGYLTQRGSSYNSYLINDEKITLVDTVKSPFAEEMIRRISTIINPADIAYVVCNHVEMDHSGALPEIMKLAPDATILISPQGAKSLKKHYQADWKIQIVKTGEQISLGKYHIEFLLTPMIHWPDNMVCFLGKEHMLFSNDAFGQHIASSERFDDEYPFTTIMDEARKYYANIVLPYGSIVKKALDAVSGLEIDIIAPSHGIIWRKYQKEIISSYGDWAANETNNQALIIYDSMWGSTAKIAQSISAGFENLEIRSNLLHLQKNHISDIMTETLTAKYICVGSPTLNNNMLPTVAGFLTYLKGLAPQNRIGMAFGSYGWGGQSIDQIDDVLQECGFDMLSKIKVQYIPDAATLKKIQSDIQRVVTGD